jgi:hemolysin III
VLIGVWSGAAAGILFTLLWVDAPPWLTAASYVALGWFSIIAVPQIVSRTGAGAAVLLAVGGVAYTAGAVVYARRRPDPRPATFGYHEIFHVLVVLAAAAHFTAVAVFAVPYGP